MNLTRREMVQTLGVGLPSIGLVLSQTGCESITTTLEAVVDTTSAAVDIAFPQYAALLNPYFSAVQMFIEQTATELASTDTAAEKFAKVAGFAAAIIAPNLQGVAAEVVTRVAAIAPLIATLVDELKGLNAAAQLAPGGENAFFAAHKRFKAPSAKDLKRIREKNAALKAKLKK
jgi:hypothetical protein